MVLFHSLLQMDCKPQWYVGFSYGVSIYAEHLVLAAWTIYSPSHSLVHVSSLCVGATTNNQVEYNVVIGLLADALQFNICHLRVHLDSRLLVAQFQNCYQVRDPCL